MIRSTLCILSGCFIAYSLPLQAQSPGAAAANTAADEVYSSGNYQGAVEAYEKLIKDYPTDALVPGAQVRLAFAYYFLGKFDQAQAILAKASALPMLTPEVKQITELLLPQILLAKAGSLPAGDAKRKTTFEEAITKFTDYINKYPQAQDLESAIYSRAIAEYQVQKYDEAIKDLELNIQKFPQSGTLAASKNLLAITLATQGSNELSKGTSADKAKAFALYKRAADLLREIINKKEDIAIMNDANFQLGEILSNQAAFSPENERAALYQEALTAYRAVAPQSDIIELQQQKIKEFPQRRRDALRTNNPNLIKQLAADNERELKKLAELQSKPDQTATAQLKMGEIFFQQSKNNEARVVFQHVTPFLEDKDEQKRALYFTTMTYALQNAADRVMSGYNEFQSKYKGDPIADNLPAALGNMYLATGNPNDAIKYFDESLTIYPNGRLAALSVVQKATAETILKNYANAEKTFKDFLAKNPSPEVGVIAQDGLAKIYKDTSKWDEALAAFKTLKEKYPNTAQSAEADYWIAICTQQKGDNVAAIPLLDAYVKANPKSPLSPIALYSKGGAQIALSSSDPKLKEEGIATLTQVAEQYPDSPPAPFTYFMIAQMRGAEGKGDDVVALMKKFIEKYPQDDKIWPAYESIANVAIGAGKTDDAANAYREFLQKNPENPQAGEAIQRLADLLRLKADSLGRYGALNEEERKQWNTNLESSIAASEEMIKKYPDTPSLALGLRTLLQSQRMLLGAELKKAPDVEAYFKALADSTPSANAKSKILFALANYVAEQDRARALQMMTEAYNPEIVYAPQDMDAYAIALIDANKLDEAKAVYDQLSKHYPIPAGVAPSGAPTAVQEAQAMVMFGSGKIAQQKKQTAEAAKFFEQLKALYPWSPKVLEANFGIAQSMKEQGKTDEALALLQGIPRAESVTPEIRAAAMGLTADLLLDKSNATQDAKQKEEFFRAGIDTNLKISQFFPAVAPAAASGLWKGGQLLEQQAATITDPKVKEQQITKARNAYEQLIKEYPNSEFVPKAQERLTALSPAK